MRSTIATKNKRRDSNLELYRIIVMLLIVAHHYVVNSGLTSIITDNPETTNSTFYMLFGAWGKTGINCFVLITGYFMCTKDISLRKFLKLFLWIYLYRLLITLIFIICDYHPLGIGKMLSILIPLKNLTKDFGTCFLVFY